MAGRQRWCRGGSVGRHADGTVGDVCRLTVRYVKTSAVVSRRNKRGRTLVVLMAMFRVWWCDIPGGNGGVVAEVSVDRVVELTTTFVVCRRGISGRQLRFHSGRVGRHDRRIYCTVSRPLSGAGERLFNSPGHFSSCKCSCHRRCCMLTSQLMFGSLWNVVVAHEHRRQDGSRWL